MNINATEVKNQRSNLNWTQQVLAQSCDLSLRTIQRVERYGKASNETMMSLCAVFEIEQKVLLIEEDDSAETSSKASLAVNPIIIVAVSVISGILVGAFMTYSLLQ